MEFRPIRIPWKEVCPLLKFEIKIFTVSPIFIDEEVSARIEVIKYLLIKSVHYIHFDTFYIYNQLGDRYNSKNKLA